MYVSHVFVTHILKIKIHIRSNDRCGVLIGPRFKIPDQLELLVVSETRDAYRVVPPGAQYPSFPAITNTEAGEVGLCDQALRCCQFIANKTRQSEIPFCGPGPHSSEASLTGTVHHGSITSGASRGNRRSV